jgi:hypothetical protein
MAQSFVEDHMHLCTKWNINFLLFFFTITKFWVNLYVFNWKEIHATDTRRSIKTTTRADAYATYKLNVLWILIPIKSKVRKIYTWVISKENTSNANKR